MLNDLLRPSFQQEMTPPAVLHRLLSLPCMLEVLLSGNVADPALQQYPLVLFTLAVCAKSSTVQSLSPHSCFALLHMPAKSPMHVSCAYSQ